MKALKWHSKYFFWYCFTSGLPGRAQNNESGINMHGRQSDYLRLLLDLVDNVRSVLQQGLSLGHSTPNFLSVRRTQQWMWQTSACKTFSPERRRQSRRHKNIILYLILSVAENSGRFVWSTVLRVLNSIRKMFSELAQENAAVIKPGFAMIGE